MSDPKNYTVGWLCAIVTEFVAAQALFDEEHDELEASADSDNNSYALGRIGKHNVVIAVLPKSEYGTTSAATVARDMMRTFCNIRIGLMVGIGGGAPNARHDIRLGDIVVSSRDGDKGGVMQYDYGKAIQANEFKLTGTLNQPPQILLTAVSSLEAKYKKRGHQLNTEIEKALQRWPRLRKEYSKPSLDCDRLYRSDYVHQNESKQCQDSCGVDPTQLIDRPERGEQDDNPAIHYGLIASANTLMKHAIVRDKLAAEHNVLCFEMEAAGLMNHFPCLVVRGICDYSDSHKNKQWQGFAAMTAAAYAKDLLSQILPSKIEAETPIMERLGSTQKSLDVVQKTVAETNLTVTSIKSDTQVAKIKRWLNPPEYSTNMNAARKCRHSGSGNWLIRSLPFEEWKLGFRRHLWLYGLAGCGKTVLSTTIIEHLSRFDNYTTLVHFFDFNTPQKQTLDGLLRSLVFQIYSRGGQVLAKLDDLYISCGKGLRQPDEVSLSTCLESMIQASERIIIILDALDECKRRDRLLDWIGSFSSGNAQFMVTARPEADLQVWLPRYFLEQNCIPLDKTSINADIRSYVLSTLQNSPSFKEKGLNTDLINIICEKVGDGADGMFRWASCQMDNLATCRSPNAIKTALGSLPHDLYETYHRMLENTPAKDKKDAVRLLQFLVHSKIPLVVPEAVEIIATRIDRESQRFDIGNRFFSEADILHCCPGMISIVEVHEYNGTTRKELHLAHFSVKEYLLTLTDFNLETSSVTITMTCLTYLTEIEGELSTLAYKFPLAKYAAEWWMDFGRIAEKSKHIVHMAVGFMQHDATYRRWHHLFNPDMIWGFGKPYPVGSELYYACAAGLVEITAALIANGSDVNAPGGYYGNALQASSHKSYLNIVRLLLEKGADVNLRGGRYGSALQAACSKQDLAIVELLLDKGADITIAGKYGSILQAACYGGSEEIIKLLLGKGIDVNIQGGKYGNALQAASRRGRLEVVNILLRNGADVNANGGDYGTALQAASWKGNLEVVNLLLDKGANVNMQGGDYGNALQAASWAGSIEVIQLLLDRGADITATSSGGWTPVNRAAYSGHLEAVKLLIEKGDDITPDNNSGNTPISYAANYENLALLQLLLSTPGTNINQTDNFGLSPLFKASRYGRSKVVQYLLLGTHADPSIRTWCGTTALFAAVANGHARTVEFLIPHYSSLEKHGGFGKSLVWWARRAGRPQITELLLKHGGKSLNLLDEEFSPEDYDALPFDPCDDWCLACTVCIAEASQYSCEECDGFLVCGDCVSKGIRCPDFTHPRPSKARPRGGLRVRKDRADMMTGEE